VSDENTPKDEVSPGRLTVFSAERAKAFIDAVVAIATTLLILPLMESISDAADADLSAGHWFVEHAWQLLSFVLSFAIIAMFWIGHHRMFARVERVTTGVLWVSMAWLLSIVWLPVATAMSGRMSDEDDLAIVVYIGSMIVVCLLTLVLRLYLRRHGELHGIPERDLREGAAADLAMASLFAISLLVAVLVPLVGYFALFLMFLTGFVQRLFARALGADRVAA
jgi:uncharacterized membrane protein